jgi:hypothetical protein
LPLEYAIDRARRVVRVRGHGVLRDEDLLSFQDRLREDAQFEPGLDQIHDYREIRELAVSAEGIRAAAERRPKFEAPVRRAVVVASDAAYGLARVFQTRREGTGGEVRVFRAWDEALAWLGLSEERAEADPRA